MRDKVLGMLLGGAIGDALGMPVETWTDKRIAKVHGRIQGYVSPIDHKYFTADTEKEPNKIYMPLGSVTDDTQLTLATLDGILLGHDKAMEQRSFDPYMDQIAHAHVLAMKQTTVGWGKTTLEAVDRLEQGVSWRDSGKTEIVGRGTGNGVAMKCSPMAAWYTSGWDEQIDPDFRFKQAMVDFAAMTHYSQMAAESAIIHSVAIYSNLFTKPDDFHSISFADALYSVYEWKEEVGHLFWDNSHLESSEDCLQEPIGKILSSSLSWMRSGIEVEEVLEMFGQGTPYVYNSLPFSYAMFLRSPNSAQAILDTVNAGGDTDTNAKLVGELLGALHGVQFFETEENKWMIDGLSCASQILDTGNSFCDKLGL